MAHDEDDLVIVSLLHCWNNLLEEAAVWIGVAAVSRTESVQSRVADVLRRIEEKSKWEVYKSLVCFCEELVHLPVSRASIGMHSVGKDVDDTDRNPTLSIFEGLWRA